jgi:RNA-directed DNA polymerase
MALTHKVSKNPSNGELINREVLPIGFSSSPVISNILFRKIDILIQKYCENKKITYTRYADDLLFSTLNSKFVHSEQFEKEISILVSTLELKLNNKKRKACENTISLNGYVIQNTKPKKMNFLSVYKEDPVGTIRLSNKKLKIIKQMIAAKRKNIPADIIMKNLFRINFDKFRSEHFNNLMFFNKYVEDQLQNKLKGYRSYLISLIQYNKKVGHVDAGCIKSVIDLVNKINKYIK